MKTLKYSRQRESIKACLMNRKDHPTADALYTSIREEFPNISLGTVYRNLNLLCETGRLLKVSIPGGSDRFDHTLQNHAHAVCTVCGTVSDVLPQALPLLEEFLQQDCGFTVRRMNLVLEGVCPRCRQHTAS